MSETEEIPPDKICNLKLSTLALNFSDSMKTIDQLADSIEETANETDAEDMADPYDENEGYDSRLEMLADKLIKEYVERGKPRLSSGLMTTSPKQTVAIMDVPSPWMIDCRSVLRERSCATSAKEMFLLMPGWPVLTTQRLS